MLFVCLFNILFIYFREGEGREKERERNIKVWLPLAHPLLGTWPATQACALTGTRTGDSLVHLLALNPLSHTSQGWSMLFRIAQISCIYRVNTDVFIHSCIWSMYISAMEEQKLKWSSYHCSSYWSNETSSLATKLRR